jgi:hypothetical protein
MKRRTRVEYFSVCDLRVSIFFCSPSCGAADGHPEGRSSYAGGTSAESAVTQLLAGPNGGIPSVDW